MTKRWSGTRSDPTKTKRSASKQARKPVEQMADEEAFSADWGGSCEICGQSPIVSATGMCGPCTFGEADTVDGNW